jgi:hypothetical protein
MNTFLKVILILVAVVLALKLLPVLLVLGGVMAAGLAVLACATLAMLVLFSPLWLPVLALIGLIALVRRAGRPA